MSKHTIAILIAERDRFFAHGLSLGLKTFCHSREVSLQLVNRDDIATSGVDIIFLGNSSACPPWLYGLYQQGCTPHVFFIRDRERSGPVAHAPLNECGAGTLYRHQPIQAIDALLDNVLSPQDGKRSPSVGKCHCASSLTFRETEVLKYLAIGMSGHDTAGCLGIKGKTVNIYMRNAMRKLCVKSHQELYRWMELGGASHLACQPPSAWAKPVRGL